MTRAAPVLDLPDDAVINLSKRRVLVVIFGDDFNRNVGLANVICDLADELRQAVDGEHGPARGLAPGSKVGALINGKQRTLIISGIALSPEFIFAGMMGMPDMRGFGVFWVDREAFAAAIDMEGAFNRVAGKLAPGASAHAAIDALGRMRPDQRMGFPSDRRAAAAVEKLPASSTSAVANAATSPTTTSMTSCRII